MTLLPSITELPLPPNSLFSSNFNSLLLNKNNNFQSSYIPSSTLSQQPLSSSIVQNTNSIQRVPAMPTEQPKILFENLNQNQNQMKTASNF